MADTLKGVTYSCITVIPGKKSASWQLVAGVKEEQKTLSLSYKQMPICL